MTFPLGVNGESYVDARQYRGKGHEAHNAEQRDRWSAALGAHIKRFADGSTR